MLDLDEIRALVAPLMKVPEVTGLSLMGSYAAGDANETSDLDIGAFFEGDAVELPALSWPIAHDLWIADRKNREKWGREGVWQASAFLPAQMLFDRDGRAERMLEAIIAVNGFSDERRFYLWDMYLNSLYRALKYHRKGCEYGFRACAAESALKYMEALFYHNGFVAPLPGRERASLKRISDKVIEDDDRQVALLLRILRDGSVETQAELFAHVEPYLAFRGLQSVIDGWEGLIHLEIGRI